MKKFCKKGHPARSGKRWLALLMSLCLIGTMLPVTARAENSSPETGLCEHHTEHTAECGYVEASEGSPCTYICKICEAQALIDALPDAGDITEENFDEVSDMLGEIDTAKEALTAEESEALDFTKYEAAVAKMMELMGQAGAGGAALMSLDGFSATGKPTGATVKTINLNAAALRPDSTWSTGGNLVYFGSYNSNPVAYRVLSSPNTQASSGNYLLLDCNTILKTMAFSSDNTNIWAGSNCTVWNWLNGAEFYDGSVFSGIEKTAIAETALAGQSVYSAGDYSFSYKDYYATNRVFCLSAAEADGLYANNNARNKTGGNASWWLRSAYSDSGNIAGVVYSGGRILTDYVDNYDFGVSPALNVNLSSVLFASENGTGKSSALASVSDSSATEWKLTLLDSSKTVNVTGGQNVTRQDTTITVPYTYTDSNTMYPVSQISVMITDKAYTESDAQVLYYGALQDVTISETTGTGTFTLPADLADQTCGTDYYAYIIAEDVNGTTETDYASAPAAITIPAASGSDPVTPDTPVAPVNGKGLGVSIIADPTAPAATTDAWAGSFVYFGTYSSNPVKYRVLDRTTTDFGGTTMLLDCDSILWKNNPSSRFDDGSNVWADSEIKTYLNGTFLSGNFTDLEQAAIAASSKASTSTTDGNGYLALDYAALSGEQIFLLDAKEATNTSYGYSNTQTQAANRKKTDRWWLRSAFSSEVYAAGCVYSNGSIQWEAVSRYSNVGVSPALNVNLSSVIFSSVLSGTAGQSGAEYKLTLQDGNMTITPGTVTRDSGDEVTVPYTIGGTNGGNATRVSLMVLDKEYTAGNTNGAKLVAYEKLADAGSTTGTFTLTDDMKNGSYYYYIVAEDVQVDDSETAVNEGLFTDYASAPVQITIPASASKYTVTVTNGTLSDGSTTGEYAQGETVTITANAAPTGQQFKEWEVVSGSITLASSISETTTFTMPAEAVSVKAGYDEIIVTPANNKGLGISIIADPTAPAATTDAWKGSYVYFGTYNGSPVKYRVLDRTTTDFGGTTMLLDCDSILWQGDNPSSRFDDDSNVWADSEIKTYLNGTFLTNNFSSLERAAIAANSKASAGTTDGNGGSYSNYAALSGEQIFLLDAKEATNTSYGYSNTDSSANRKKTGGNADWWLRSAHSLVDSLARIVRSDGNFYHNPVNSVDVGVSPALNVNLSSVIFSSVLSGISGQPGAEYKLTLQDGNMTITPGTVTRDSGDEVTVPYTIGGTNGGNATRVSLMVLDKEYTAGNTNGAKLVAYEKLADAGSTSGTFTLTDDMKNGSYYYYIVAEDVNDGNATDYASAPVQITIPASKYTVTVTNGTLSDGSTTGEYAQGETVTITANAAPTGQQFKEWEVVSGSITLASSTSETTTFTMPAEAVSVKAVYENTSNSGGGSSSGGSSGGSSGNSSITGSSEVTTGKDSGSNVITTTSPTEVKVENGTASATVKAENVTEAIKQAADNKSAEIVFTVSEKDTGNADNIRLTMTMSDVKQILDKTDADLVVATTAGDVILPQETLKEAVSAAGGNDITIEIDKVTTPTDVQKEAAGENSYIVEVTIKSQNKAITTFGGNTLRIRLEIPAALIGKDVAVIHIAEDGKTEKMSGKTITEGMKQYYEFTTTHLSTFALIEETEEGNQPSEPTDPETPSEPTDPETPSEPTVPAEPTKPEVTAPKTGTLLTHSKTKMVYKVSKSGTTGGTVQFVKTKNTKTKTVTIPDKVTMGGITYKVTSIATGALKNKKAITKVVIGKHVTKIGKKAFSGCSKLKVLKINSTKLTSGTLSGLSMKGISTKTVIKVPKSKVKAYKKLFVKKGLSKKVKVKSL